MGAINKGASAIVPTAKVLASAVIPMPRNMPRPARNLSAGPVNPGAGTKRFSHAVMGLKVIMDNGLREVVGPKVSTAPLNSGLYQFQYPVS